MKRKILVLIMIFTLFSSSVFALTDEEKKEIRVSALCGLGGYFSQQEDTVAVEILKNLLGDIELNEYPFSCISTFQLGYICGEKGYSYEETKEILIKAISRTVNGKGDKEE